MTREQCKSKTRQLIESYRQYRDGLPMAQNWKDNLDSLFEKLNAPLVEKKAQEDFSI